MFLGLTVANLKSFPGGTKKQILDRHRRPGIAVLIAFGVGIFCIGAATGWLTLLYDHHVLYLVTLGLFAAQLLSLVGATVWTVRRTMWG